MLPVPGVLDLDRLLAGEYSPGLDELPLAELWERRAEYAEAEVALALLRRLVQVRLDVVVTELAVRGGAGVWELSPLAETRPCWRSPAGAAVAGLALGGGGLAGLTAELDAIVDDEAAGTMAWRDEGELRRLGDALVRLERRVAAQRRALAERIDRLQSEVVRRYRCDGAGPDAWGA